MNIVSILKGDSLILAEYERSEECGLQGQMAWVLQVCCVTVGKLFRLVKSQWTQLYVRSINSIYPQVVTVRIKWNSMCKAVSIMPGKQYVLSDRSFIYVFIYVYRYINMFINIYLYRERYINCTCFNITIFVFKYYQKCIISNAKLV